MPGSTRWRIGSIASAAEVRVEFHTVLRRQTWMMVGTMVTLVLTVLSIGQLG